MEYIPWLHLLLHAVAQSPGKGIYSNLPQLDGVESYKAEQGLDIHLRTFLVSNFVPPVHCNCKCSRSTPPAHIR